MDNNLERFVENKIDSKVREKWFYDIREQYIALRVEERDRIVSYFDKSNKRDTQNNIEKTKKEISNMNAWIQLNK